MCGLKQPIAFGHAGLLSARQLLCCWRSIIIIIIVIYFAQNNSEYPIIRQHMKFQHKRRVIANFSGSLITGRYST